MDYRNLVAGEEPIKVIDSQIGGERPKIIVSMYLWVINNFI